ncbi:MAG: STAS domain-containing protein [Calditrichia bacterium]
MIFHIDRQQDKSVIVIDKNNIVGPETGGIQNAVLDLVENQAKTILLDLSKVNYISSYGIGMLMYAYTTCTKRNVEFYLTGVNEKVLKILEIVNLNKIFIIKDNI